MMGTSRTQWNRQKGYLTFLESELRGKRFFEGDALGLVDIISNYIAFWDGVLQQMAEIDKFNEKKNSVLWKWSQEFLCSDVVQKSLPDTD